MDYNNKMNNIEVKNGITFSIFNRVAELKEKPIHSTSS